MGGSGHVHDPVFDGKMGIYAIYPIRVIMESVETELILHIKQDENAARGADG
jgi:hypothetical protein